MAIAFRVLVRFGAFCARVMNACSFEFPITFFVHFGSSPFSSLTLSRCQAREQKPDQLVSGTTYRCPDCRGWTSNTKSISKRAERQVTDVAWDQKSAAASICVIPKSAAREFIEET